MNTRNLAVILSAMCLYTSSVQADVTIIVGKHYAHKNYHHNYRGGHGYGESANNYSRRHNFGNNAHISNPYINRNSSYDRLRQSRTQKILTAPGYSYSKRFSDKNRLQHNLERKRHYGFNQGYKKGYQDGVRDAYGYRNSKKRSSYFD